MRKPDGELLDTLTAAGHPPAACGLLPFRGTEGQAVRTLAIVPQEELTFARLAGADIAALPCYRRTALLFLQSRQ
jgi:hypothetical protein